MDSNLISRHTIAASAPLVEALEKINKLSGGAMTLFALDSDGSLAGTITDGDIRRALLAGLSLNEMTSAAMHTGFRAIRPDLDTFYIVRDARAKGIDLLPKLDEKGRIERIIDLREVKNILPLDAVLMAGGRGERLRPLTLTTPKPLLEIGGKPIIDYNIEELESNGVEHIFVTVNYLASQIEEHFAVRANKATVECVREPRRLGTIGSLALIHSLTQPDLLLMNSDLLTDLKFDDMFAHHKQSGSDLTMAVIPYNVSVPFAVIETDGDRITGLQEKPSLNYFANAGVYIMRTELVKRIPVGEALDAPDFVENLINAGLKVTYFPISGRWIDIGSPQDFKLAAKLMER